MQEANWSLARKRPALEQRARIVQTIRAFFVAQDFLEVETPQRIPANAPEPQIDAVACGEWFLQTSPELCMKRLLAAGYPLLFQICRVWRNSERGRRHLPEFTLLEWYRAHADYRALMADCEGLLRALVPGGRLRWQGEEIELGGEWERLTVAEAFARHAGCSAREALAAGEFDARLTAEVEPHLGRERPTLLLDYPAELAALARRKGDAPELAERFELYIAGLELANGFSELTDPVEQLARFQRDEAERRTQGKPPYPLPQPFLDELPAMPAAAGIALGVDRLVMLLTGADALDQIVPFTPESL